MKLKITSSLLAICVLLIVSCGGGGGSTTSDTSNPSSVKLLASEFEDESNWIAYETFDQLENEGQDLYSTSNLHPSIVTSPKPLDREKIVTYTANGLVSESFEYLVSNSEGIAMGSRNYGVSVIKFSDMASPKGKVYNFRKNNLEGLAEYQNKFYAWFLDGSIVDIADGQTIYTDAPHGTNSIYSAIPKNRFVIDNGVFYIGTSNLNSDGSQIAGADNGFWMIDNTLSTKTKLIDHPVWCVYKDSNDLIWVGTKDGIYKGNGAAFENVFSGYAEQIFEFNNQIYALVKDFFNHPDENNNFDLYQWDGTTFQYVCEVSDVYGSASIYEMNAFEWESTLYVSARGYQNELLVFDGNSFSLQNNPIYDGKIGQQCANVADGKLFTVGNLTGLNIWDGSELVQLNTVNTAEALISNAIRVLYIDDDGNLLIGPEASGFNILDVDGNFESKELAEETTIAGFFENKGVTYVQGASALYKVTDNSIQYYAAFACNGERVYYDVNHGKLWAFPNFGSGNGALGMLDVDTMEISGTTGYDDRADYWQRDYEWDKPEYHFNDVVSIPNEDAVFIAVENGNSIVLKYDYNTNEFTEISIPIESIKYFDVKGSAVYGVGQGNIVKYEAGKWEIVNSNLASGVPTGFAVKNDYAFIPRQNSLEVVHLVSGKTSLWNFDELPIKGQITAIKIRTNENPGIISKAYSMILGTTEGLVICNLNLQ